MAGSLPQSGVSLIAQNAGRFLSDMRSAEGALGSFQRGAGAMSQIVTGALRRVGEMVTEMAARAVKAVGHWLKDSIGVAGDFEQTLNVLGATSGATAADLDRVAAKAKELGADLTLPATSAGDAAEVMLELSKAGFTVQESMDAAKGALQLAAAAQVDSATAAQITAGAINAFNLEASDAVRIADLLAGGANASSASMTDLAAGLQQAGFMFHAVGMPVEDLITSLAALTNVGLTGSDAGTALKNALVRLTNPTKKAAGLMAELGFNAYDANGRMKPLPQLITDLNRSLAGMTDEQRNAALGTIFLSDGMKAMIPLLELGEDGFMKLKGSVTEQGAAADVAAAQMKGWNGGIQAVGSQMETLQLVVGTFLKNALTPFLFRLAETISRITTLADRFFTLLPEVQKAADPFSKLMSLFVLLNPSLAGVAFGLLKIVQAVAPMITALTDGNVSFTDLHALLTSILAPLGATQASINSATGAFVQIQAAVQRVVAVLQGEAPGALSTAQGALASVINFVLGSVLPALAQVVTWFARELPTGIATAKAAFADIGGFIQTIMPTIQSIVSTALQLISVLWQNHSQDLLTIVTGLWEGIKGAIQIVLGAIQGILAIFLGLATNDWDTAMTTIRASNETIWNGIQQFLGGILNAIAGIFGTTLDGLIALWQSNFRNAESIARLIWTNIGDLINTKVAKIKSDIESIIGAAIAFVTRIFGEGRDAIDSAMSSASSIVQSKIDSIKGAFDSIKSVIDGVISKIKSLISTLSNIQVPDILTPGSPTPFEIGLRGIITAATRAADVFRTQFGPAVSKSVTSAAGQITDITQALAQMSGGVFTGKVITPSKLPKSGTPRAPEWPPRKAPMPKPPTPKRLPPPGSPRAPEWPRRAPSEPEDMYQAIDRLTREAAARAAQLVAKAVTPSKLSRGPIWQTLGQYKAPVASARALIPPTNMSTPQTTTNTRTYQMPIYTNQSPAVLSQSLALIEALI